jgi:hypothetical protein
MKYLTVIPAYGRDYKSQKEIMNDFNNGKDFLIQDVFGSGYINKQDIERSQEKIILNVRYSKFKKVCVIK